MAKLPEPGTPQPPHPHGGRREESVAEKLWWYRDARQPEPPAPPARPRWSRERTLDALACLAVSALCFSQARNETLFRGDWYFYNRVPLGPPTLLALLLNLLAVAGAGFLGVRMMRRIRRPAWQRLAAVAATAVLLIAMNYVRLTHETLVRWTDAIGGRGLLAFVVLALAASVGWPRPALRTVRGVALIASPLALITLAQCLWMFLEVAAGPVWRRVDPEPIARGAPSLRRVVWLVFGELDQRLAFETRPTGVELPELDRLRRQSLYAVAARPPAGAMDVVMPALITGQPVMAVTPANPNDLDLTLADGRTVRWSAQPNVFSRARVLGYDTALVGWGLPYPRVLGASLGIAEWRPTVAHEQARGSTFGEAFENQWGSLAPPVHARRVLSRRVSELGDLALRAATDGRFGLVLLHLPIPRPPGIYDRASGRLTPWNFSGGEAGYLDNLALVDRLLGSMRHGLERTRLGDRTWLVVSSDHWWPGQVDHRVPFLVRPPDGGREAHVDVVLNTLAAHDLVLAILRGSISDTSDAVAWLTRHKVETPRDYTRAGRPIY